MSSQFADGLNRRSFSLAFAALDAKGARLPMPPFWCVVRAEFGSDRLAVISKSAREFETFWPRTRCRVGAQWKTEPLFRGYFFCRIVDQLRMLSVDRNMETRRRDQPSQMRQGLFRRL
jgi:hypothetical protein